MRINLLEREYHMQIDSKFLPADITSKIIIADLNKGEKFSGDNYDIWSRKNMICTRRVKCSIRYKLCTTQKRS